ncbi:hypothetical protein Q5424_15135 [Conexibacter sp. JD483]|uniref:hypothetical protein n=1 Tax=unclassified Conexibacter TaxID=2627773 RepID=UPI0027173E34|nr:MULTISPECIES: hypothetical protein [unclassified Conexibacter]MDO8188140.1 hypothetical protein [Conexibacter sp. CPCC 205706]MDO8201296.1 hypothetical protein [Conexibacter sp. CPCC 205762]MDR9370432.1 hypothetical protein [Conexibacter sp. JD483]
MAHVIDESSIRETIDRLARVDAKGGRTIERAALVAEGSDFGAIEAWILRHGGEPELAGAAARSGGLHGARTDAGRQRASGGAPTRYLLPPDALS